MSEIKRPSAWMLETRKAMEAAASPEQCLLVACERLYERLNGFEDERGRVLRGMSEPDAMAAWWCSTIDDFAEVAGAVVRAAHSLRLRTDPAPVMTALSPDDDGKMVNLSGAMQTLLSLGLEVQARVDTHVGADPQQRETATVWDTSQGESDEHPSAGAGQERRTDPGLDAMLGCRALAQQFHVNCEALRKRLDRRRRQNHGDWFIEVADCRPRDPRYLYKVRDVLPIIRNMQSSTERPSKRKKLPLDPAT